MSQSNRKRAPEPYFNTERKRWELQVELPALHDGQRRRKRIIGRTKSECREKADAVRSEITATGTAARGDLTIKMLMAEYLELTEGDVKRSTMEVYQRWSRLYVVPYIGKSKVAKMNVADVKRWHRALSEAGHSPATIRSAHRVLRQALTHAVRSEYVGRNVAMLASAPKVVTKEVTPLTPDQVGTLLQAVEGWRYEALVYVLLGCGLRMGEALGLTWDAVDFDTGIMTVGAQVREFDGTGKEWIPDTKGSRTRIVAIGGVTAAKIREHRRRMIEERLALGAGAPAGGDVIFPNEFHALGDRSNIARELKKLGTDAGIAGLHPHQLRHTYVSLALDDGVAIEAISETVGHKSIRLTKDTYGKLQDRGRRRVADAVDRALGG